MTKLVAVYICLVLKLDDSVYGNLLLAAKKVALILENGLLVKRVALVCEGMGINHAHVKLYPLHGLNDEFIAMNGTNRVYFEKYDGHLSTLLGPESSEKELVDLATQLKNCLTRRSS